MRLDLRKEATVLTQTQNGNLAFAAHSPLKVTPQKGYSITHEDEGLVENVKALCC